MDGHHIVPANQKLMRYEDLKIHIAEVERCQKHTQTNLSLQYFSRKISEKMKPCNSNLGIANARASQTTSTSSPSMCISLPASSSVSPWSPTTSYSRNSPRFPDSSRPYPQEIFFRGTWRLIEMAKWVLAEPTTDTVSAWMKWSPHAGSHFSQTFYGIATLDYQLMDLHA